jgi:hypothetical protein
MQKLQELFQLWCITPAGREIKVGTPATEREAVTFREAHLGCIGEQVGNRYVVRPA